MKVADLTFAEMYNGIGGFRLGLERAGWRCVWANDNDKYANRVYKKKFGGEELVEGDIREVQAKAVPDCTLLTAGFPCQAFSVAGKRKGFKESRGTLFTHIARVAAHKRPPLLLLENVKGLLSSDSGRTFAIIIRVLENLGYLVEWQVLNSKHFGVPQNRERVFIIGHLRGKGSRQVFPINEANPVSTQNEGNGKRVASCLDRNYHKGARRQRTLVLQEHSFSGKDGRGRGLRTFEGEVPTLTQQMGTGGGNVPMVVADRTRTYAGKGRNLESPKPLTNALSSVEKDNLVIWIQSSQQKKGGIKSRKGLVPTLGERMGTGGRNVPMVLANAVDCDGYLRFGHRPRDEQGKPQLIPIGYRRIRRLTPVECERLQGFPDGWTEGVSDTQRYKLLGNAVTVNVVEFLGKKLRECLV